MNSSLYDIFTTRPPCRRRPMRVIPPLWLLVPILMVSILLGVTLPIVRAEAKGFGAYLVDVKPEEVFPGADRFGPLEGTPPAMAAFKGDRLLGYVFSTSDTGYSGKPVKLLIGMDKAGVIVGAKVTEHHEPILLAGIPPEHLTAFVDGFVGRNIVEAAQRRTEQQVDAIAGATVTAIVINDSVSRAALKVARAYGLAGFSVTAADAPVAAQKTLATVAFQKSDWQTMLGDGSIRRLHLLNSEVDEAFKKIGVGSPEPFGKAGVPTDDFIDLYAALVSVESIGRNLLGDDEYHRLNAWLAPGQHAVLLMANGD